MKRGRQRGSSRWKSRQRHRQGRWRFIRSGPQVVPHECVAAGQASREHPPLTMARAQSSRGGTGRPARRAAPAPRRAPRHRPPLRLGCHRSPRTAVPLSAHRRPSCLHPSGVGGKGAHRARVSVYCGWAAAGARGCRLLDSAAANSLQWAAAPLCSSSAGSGRGRGGWRAAPTNCGGDEVVADPLPHRHISALQADKSAGEQVPMSWAAPRAVGSPAQGALRLKALPLAPVVGSGCGCSPSKPQPAAAAAADSATCTLQPTWTIAMGTMNL